MENEMVTISKVEYDRLKKDAFILECLYERGVENWRSYSEKLFSCYYCGETKPEMERVDLLVPSWEELEICVCSDCRSKYKAERKM